MIQNLNFVFFGTPEFAIDVLKELKKQGISPSLIITAPDKPQGRKLILTPPPVKIWAEKESIPVLQPEVLDENFRLKLEAGNPQLSIVVAYGKIFPQWLIDLPQYGTLNIHYSLLPKYRGAAPVQAAILAGDTKTGVTIQKMVYELDAGPIVAQEEVEIRPDEKAREILERLVPIGAKLLVKTLKREFPLLKLKEQDHTKATKAPKIKKEDGLINLDDDPELNWRKFRAYDVWPGTYFFATKGGKKIRTIIKDAKFEDGSFDETQGKKFKIKKVLPEGRKEMDYQDFLNQHQK